METKYDADGMPKRPPHVCDDCKPKHTPTPWHTASDESGYFRCIEKDDRLIARLPSSDSLQAEKDAAFIVRAVNHYELLLDIAIDEHRKYLEMRQGKHDPKHCETCKDIAKAEGK